MARFRRVKFEKDRAIYHVMIRTAQKAFLFNDPVVKEWIYRRIVALSRIYYVDLYAVTVMDNHYHVVLAMRKPTLDQNDLQKRFEARQGQRRYPDKWFEWRSDGCYKKLTDLSAFMKELNQSIAFYVNQKHQTRGHLWGDRFKSVLIEDGRGLLTCMAYVELNCVRAEICKQPKDYRWCSVGRFLSGGAKAAGVTFPHLPGFECLKKQGQRQRGFAYYVDYLAQLGQGEAANFPAEYGAIQDLVNQADLSPVLELVLQRTRWMLSSLVLGSQDFCEEAIRRFGLQRGRFGDPIGYDLGNHLFNSHQRAGPFLK